MPSRPSMCFTDKLFKTFKFQALFRVVRVAPRPLQLWSIVTSCSNWSKRYARDNQISAYMLMSLMSANKRDSHKHSALQIGRETLEEEFTQMLERDMKKRDRDDIFDNLKAAVKDESMSKHQWDEKAEDSLVSNLCISHSNPHELTWQQKTYRPVGNCVLHATYKKIIYIKEDKIKRDSSIPRSLWRKLIYFLYFLAGDPGEHFGGPLGSWQAAVGFRHQVHGDCRQGQTK